MKRFLLFVMMCVLTAVQVLAQTVTSSTWSGPSNTEYSGQSENVAVIEITTPGTLSSAAIPSGVTMLRIKGKLNSDDITALSYLPYRTIDLQDAYLNDSRDAFTFTNSTVQNLILPDNWTRDQVNAAALQCSSLHSAFSHGTFESFGASITAYVKECGTLLEAIAHSSYNGEKNFKLRTDGLDFYQLDKLKKVTISGYPSARDYFGNGGTGSTKFYTADGHLKYSPAPIENDSQRRTRVGDYTLLGALDGASLISLDLEKAVIRSEYNEDLIFMENLALGAVARELVIPTDPSVDTLPADFMSKISGNENGIGQICIPANIKYIKTRAFLKSHTIDHIWTTSSDPNTKVDNGYCMGYNDHGEEIMGYGMRPLTGSKWDFLWGTYTLPPALELIETAAFGGKQGDDARVRDVYSLNEIAPECHVDAFHATMYHGNNNFSSTRISADGIVTREAYGVASNDGKNIYWKTMLHYPRTTRTPSIQRYTDPTREYSIVTGDVDGNGSPIYFPDQSEIARAYMQGTFGYVWNAWDPTRKSDGSRAWVNAGVFGSYGVRNGYDSDSQGDANDMWAANTVTPDNPHNYTSFYDVTDGGNYTQPTGLEYYYNVKWDESSYTLGTTSGTQLYPEAVLSAPYKKYVEATSEDITNGATLYVKNTDGSYSEYSGSPESGVTYYTCVQRQVVVDGVPQFEECSGNPQYVKDYRYEKSSTGHYVRDITATENTSGIWVKDYTWEENNVDGKYYHPFVKASSTSPDDYAKYYYYNSKEDKYQKDNNGLYVNGADFNQPENGYVLASEASGWWGADNVASAQHYSLAHVWHKCSSTDDYYNHASHPGVWEISTIYAEWSSDVSDYEASVAGTRYDKVYTDPVDYRAYNASTDAGETRYDIVDNGYVEYTDAYAGQQLYEKVEYYRAPQGSEVATHCPVWEDALFYDVIKSRDYRGWHQFVLTGYSANTSLIMEPLTSYIKDNDWWTICAPYDLRYTDMMKLFGSEAQNHKPYLSKLLYVVRDVENQRITLMFSKNLMEYMEYQMDGIEKKSINDANDLQKPGTYVHGIVDDTKWSDEDLEKNPIILHAGVPYLIKPYLDDISMRQFDIYKNTQPEGLTVPVGKNVIKDDWLYESFRKSRNLTPSEQLSLIYKGEYQVPAYVINNTAGEGTQDSREITMNEGPTFNYAKSSSENPFTFKNKEYTDMMVSSDYTYTFVGSLYLSVMPQYSYFLGWDSKNDRAAFWYNKVQDASKLTWNNETGVICPNWKLGHEITPAKTEPSLRAAQWDAVVGTDITSDDIKGSVGAKGFMDMEFGNSMLLSFEDEFGIATSVQELHNTSIDETVYDIHGVKVGTSLRGLAKGVYIMNGKKFVVK
jgi:hypothetical protein